MKLRQLIVLACALLAVSACVIEPYGGGGYDHGGRDYGHRAWHE